MGGKVRLCQWQFIEVVYYITYQWYRRSILLRMNNLNALYRECLLLSYKHIQVHYKRAMFHTLSVHLFFYKVKQCELGFEWILWRSASAKADGQMGSSRLCRKMVIIRVRYESLRSRPLIYVLQAGDAAPPSGGRWVRNQWLRRSSSLK